MVASKRDLLNVLTHGYNYLYFLSSPWKGGGIFKTIEDLKNWKNSNMRKWLYAICLYGEVPSSPHLAGCDSKQIKMGYLGEKYVVCFYSECPHLQQVGLWFEVSFVATKRSGTGRFYPLTFHGYFIFNSFCGTFLQCNSDIIISFTFLSYLLAVNPKLT